MWYKSRFFKYATGLILILLIVFLFGQVGFVLGPLSNAITVVALPLILTLLFYYLLRPLVKFLEKRGLPKFVSILVSFLLTVGLLILLGVIAGNTIVNEFNQLFNRELPRVFDSMVKSITDLINSGNLDFLSTGNVMERASNFIGKSIQVLGEGLFSGISTVASAITAVFLVPFILFYFLKDDKLFANSFINIFPKKYRNEARDLLVDIDKTLSSFITGQALVCVVIGVLMYIGYLIIGIKYALALAVFSMITAMIPFLGPILGVIPAFLVGLSDEWFTLVKILIVMVIVQQLEGNLITPQIMGKRIHTHPVTIILVILIAASLFGIVGILLAIPSYAVLKVIIKNLRDRGTG